MTRKRECAACHRKQTADQMLYSRHTGNYYCRHYGPCEQRVHRAKQRLEKDRQAVIGPIERGDSLLIAAAIGDRVIRAAETAGHPLAARISDEARMMQQLRQADHNDLQRDFK